MRNTIIILFLAIMVLGCGTKKDSFSQLYQADAYRQVIADQRLGYLAFKSDSLQQQWYFYSDTAFVYHPDNGLTANSGLLWMQQTKLAEEQQTAVQETSSSNMDITTEKLKNQTKTTVTLYVCCGLVIAVIIVFLIGLRYKWYGFG